MRMNTMYIPVGTAFFALRIQDPAVYTFFQSLYQERGKGRTARVCVSVDIVRGKRNTVIDAAKKQIVLSFPSRDKEYGVLFDMLRGAVSQFLPLAHTMLLHASVVVMSGKAYIFVGDVGAGKTTIRTLLSQYPCYGDDTAVISFQKNKVLAFPSPWYETSKQIYLGPGAPIAGIYFISHTKKHVVKRVSTATSYIEVVKNLKHYLIKPYQVQTDGLLPFQTNAAVAISSLSETFVRTTPCYTLGFTPKSLAFLDMILVHSHP